MVKQQAKAKATTTSNRKSIAKAKKLNVWCRFDDDDDEEEEHKVTQADRS